MKRKTRRPTAETVIKAVSTIRKHNLLDLVGEGRRFAEQQDLASALGVGDSYLSQLIGVNPRKRVTETTARKF